MSKKKEENNKDKNEKGSFDLQEALQSINPFLVEGLQRYIYENELEIKSQKDFDKLVERYGGF